MSKGLFERSTFDSQREMQVSNRFNMVQSISWFEDIWTLRYTLAFNIWLSTRKWNLNIQSSGEQPDLLPGRVFIDCHISSVPSIMFLLVMYPMALYAIFSIPQKKTISPPQHGWVSTDCMCPILFHTCRSQNIVLGCYCAMVEKHLIWVIIRSRGPSIKLNCKFSHSNFLWSTPFL